MSCLIMENIDSLTITRYSDFQIHFCYNDIPYLLYYHSVGNMKRIILYRKSDENSSRNLTHLCNIEDTGDFDKFIVFTDNGEVDKEQFLRRMVLHNLAYNHFYNIQCSELDSYIRMNRKSIDNLNKIISMIESDSIEKINDFLNSGVTPNASLMMSVSSSSSDSDISKFFKRKENK